MFVTGSHNLIASEDDSVIDENPKKEKKTETFKSAEIVVDQPKDGDEKNIHGIPYSIKFKGDLNDDIVEDLKKFSMLLKLSNRLPSSITGLGKRADQDKKKFRKVLAAKGYLGAKVDFRLSEKDNRMVVKFTIKAGRPYKILSINMDVVDNPLLFDTYSKELISTILDLNINEDVSFDKILNATKLLKRYLQSHGYPFVDIEKPIGYVEHKKKGLNVTFKIRTGVLSYINRTEIYGLKDVEEPFIRNRITWKEGDLYSIEALERTKSKLGDTQLVGSTIIDPSPVDLRDCMLDENQKAIPQPLTLKATIKEGPPRAIGASARYSMSEKLGGRIYWHHNNLFGGQEHFGITFKSNILLRKLKVLYELFDVLYPLQNVTYEGVLQRDSDPFSYNGNTQSLSVTISRPVFSMLDLKAGIGVIYENATLSQDTFINPLNNFNDNHKIFGFPISIAFDTTNHKLDPAQGIRANASLTPYFGKMQGTNSMLLLKAGGSIYLPLLKTPLGDPLFVIASFVHFGKMFIQENVSPPLNKRFFAGGASSVRAYGLKTLSPFATNSSKNVLFLGGRSMIEVGGEIRYRINEDWGCVAFVEGAIVDTAVVNVDRAVKSPFLWGPGVGIRYFTNFAPIRVDVAFPAKRRRELTTNKVIDSPFQFYISIGQAF